MRTGFAEAPCPLGRLPVFVGELAQGFADPCAVLDKLAAIRASSQMPVDLATVFVTGQPLLESIQLFTY